MYFPKYGTRTIVRSSSNCCRLSFHSLSASDSPRSLSLSIVELEAESGRESISSSPLDCSREGSSMMEGVESATEVDILRVIGVIRPIG